MSPETMDDGTVDGRDGTDGTPAVSRRSAWVMAARPQTLPAAVAPVLVGTGLAVHDGRFAADPAAAALLGAVLIQIGTNFANDYYDAVKGVDTDDRRGFTRATQAGLLPATAVRRAAYATFGLAILVGGYLVVVGGVPILVVGLLSVASGLAYAGGPYPLGSHGLGDLFVFVFFGLVAVTGTYYVQAAAILAAPPIVTPPPGTITAAAVLGSLPIAGIATGILVVNNVRDIETDRRAGKRTLAVRIGRRWSVLEYAACLGLGYVVPVWFLAAGFGPGVLLVYLTMPYAGLLVRTVATADDADRLNRALERTGRLLAAYAALFAIGVVV